MPDSNRRLVLRLTLKFLTLTALLFFGYILFSAIGEGDQAAPTIAPMRIELTQLATGQPQRLTWAGGPLQLLRLAEEPRPLLFFDRGGKLGCPLSWQPPGNSQAPQQPWPGGFRDQCDGVWYRYDGTVLPGQAVDRDLDSPPHRLQDDHLLLIGGNGDNAPPAN